MPEAISNPMFRVDPMREGRWEAVIQPAFACDATDAQAKTIIVRHPGQYGAYTNGANVGATLQQCAERWFNAYMADVALATGRG